jgi:hypothetical protein
MRPKRWSIARTLIEELASLKSGDVVLTARSPHRDSPRQIRLRCVTEPTESQAALFQRLGLTPSRRLRRLDDVAQM